MELIILIDGEACEAGDAALGTRSQVTVVLKSIVDCDSTLDSSQLVDV